MSSTITSSKKVVVEREVAGRRLRLEAGELAKQAGGAVVVSYGDTTVIMTATSANSPRPGIDFFPLTVEYEERMYAAGKIPGGFIKREGRMSERQVLICRLIDRPIRPLFPEGYRNDVQVVGFTITTDQQNEPDIPAIIAASAALTISDIPFDGPIGAVKIGLIDGQLVVNPTYNDLQGSEMNLVVAGTKDAIMMVECGAKEVPEARMLEALELAQKEIRAVCEMIEELAAKAGKPKRQIPVYAPNADLSAFVRKQFTAPLKAGMRVFDKQARETALGKVNREAAIEAATAQGGAGKDKLLALLQDGGNHDFDSIVKHIEEEELRTMIVDENLRPDGRTPIQIRPLGAAAGLFPRIHGSALFTRGQTQVLSIVTLGPLSEEQRLDNISLDKHKRYMHQYNFPSFSVGETRPMRGPGRREIGHGALAERAVAAMLPPEDEFPYAIRVVSEVLESNGSTSMASACASCLALMDAGVPMKKPVGGIAMGLVVKGKDYKVLTDIQGMEDNLGEMDFKVAGTQDGITALQMDIKTKGITTGILKEALAQAKDARMEILAVMTGCLPQARAELSPFAPRMITFVIHPDKIKDVIGPGGKVINKIIADTGVKIDIEQDGRVFIASIDEEAGKKAKQIIDSLTRDVEVGEVYTGKVVRLMNFGAFVELLPGKDGLVHISQLSANRVERVEDVVNIGDEIQVKVAEIDSMGRINLTRRGLPGFGSPEGMDVPESPEGADNGGYRPRPPSRSGPGRPGGFGGGGSRGGSRSGPPRGR